MFNFSILVKQSGQYVSLSSINGGISVFPLNIGQLLDEKLNEAYVTIVKSKIPYFKPTTEMQAVVTNGNKTNRYYFIVARDDAVELPNGSGEYRHDLYLIERTKWLEGILGQTITFTNTGKNIYTANAVPVIPVGADSNSEGYLAGYAGYSRIKSPIALNEAFTVPSAQAFGEALIPHLIENNETFIEWTVTEETILSDNTVVKTKVDVTNGAETSVLLWDAEETVYPANNIELYYTVVYNYTDTVALTRETLIVRAKFSIIAVQNRYPMPLLTVTDCINRCLELAKPVFYGERRKYYLDPVQEAEFAKILAPEFTMTQATLREQLKVIGGFIHAEPRLLGGLDRVTLNDGTEVLREQIIHFDPLGVSEESAAPSVYVGNALTYDINQYCTQIDSTAQNIVNALNWAQGVIVHPSKNKYTAVRTESVNVRVEEGNAFIATSFPVQSVKKIECNILGDNGVPMFDGMLDITPYVFENTEYSANLSSYRGQYPRSKAYAIYYTIGQRNIQGLFFKADSTLSEIAGQYWTYYSIVNIIAAASGNTSDGIRGMIVNSEYVRQLVFRVTYIPLYQTRVSHGKQMVEDAPEYTQIYNQGENLIETRYYGENLKGVAARLGNVEQSRTYIVRDLDAIPPLGTAINTGTEETPNTFAVSGINAQIMPEYVRFTLALTKDFNRISEYVGISSQKRVFEVSERNAYARNILLKEYAVIGKAQTPALGIFRNINAIANTFGSNADREDQVTEAYAWGGTKSNPREIDGDAPLNMVALPVVSSAFGNAIVFSFNYKDNFSAGERLTAQAEGGVSGWWQQDTQYGDYYGRMEWLNFYLACKGEGRDEYSALTLAGMSRDLPFLQSQNVPTTARKIGTQEKPYHVQKDSREVLQVNYELEFKSNLPYLIIGSGIASNCPLVGAQARSVSVFLFNEKINKFDRVYGNSYYSFAITVTQYTDGRITLNFGENAATVAGAAAWAIATEKTQRSIDVDDGNGGKTTQTIEEGGEILIGCNDPAKFRADAGDFVSITLVNNL